MSSTSVPARKLVTVEKMIGGKKLSIETGRLAKQASGAVVVRVGDTMTLVATMGLQWDKAMLESILEGRHTIERKGTAFFGGATMSLDRPRPPKNEPRQSTSDQQ